MKVDVEGNIYSAGPGGVVVLSPEGKHLATLLIPERVGNLAWGGADRKRSTSAPAQRLPRRVAAVFTFTT
jgi:sugar lactone lactonase YvrE